MAAARRGLSSGSGPPSLAATMISRTSLLTNWPFFCALASRPACFHCAPMQDHFGTPARLWQMRKALIRHQTIIAAVGERWRDTTVLAGIGDELNAGDKVGDDLHGLPNGGSQIVTGLDLPDRAGGRVDGN